MNYDEIWEQLVEEASKLPIIRTTELTEGEIILRGTAILAADAELTALRSRLSRAEKVVEAGKQLRDAYRYGANDEEILSAEESFDAALRGDEEERG